MSNNAIVLWESPNGISIPKNVIDINNMVGFISILTDRERSNISKAFNSELYDMSTEYTWNRTISVLRKKILSFGKEFVLEMLGRTDPNPESSQDFLSEIDIINLSADLGFISKGARLLFTHYSEMIMYYSSRPSVAGRDEEDEMDVSFALTCIKNCIKYVLGFTESDFSFSFSNFRDKLKRDYIKNDEELLRTLQVSTYFYKRTTVRTLLNLSKSAESAELENVLANLVCIIPEIWNDLLSDDRYPIGHAYSEAVSNGNTKLVKALKSVLLNVKGFDYVPETLRSNTFVEAAIKLLNTHFSINNYHYEPAAARYLMSLGSSIPVPALGRCVTASIACVLGNYYGISWDAQEYLRDILGGLTPDRWIYYLNQVLPIDEIILDKLAYDKPLENFMGLVQNYRLKDLNITNPTVKKLLTASSEGNLPKIRKFANDLKSKLR